MNRHRKREHNFDTSAVVEKVLQAYGQGKTEDGDKDINANVGIPKGRKQRRRDKKLLKKQNKQQNFQRKSKTLFVEQAAAQPEVKAPAPPEPKKPKISPQDKKKKALEAENAREDKIISALEKKFHLNKRKNTKKLPKSFIDSGLDYILDVLGDGSSERDLEVSGDDADDFFSNSKKKGVEDISELMGQYDDSPAPSDDENEVDDDINSDDNSSDTEALEKEMQHDFSENNPQSSPSVDIADESNAGKYVPPALRVKFSGKQEEEIRKLKRKTKGLLNRLSNANISSICTEIETMYGENSRAIMHKVVSDVILEQFAAPDPVPGSLALETAMLVTVLSARVAVEVLMHFYEVVTLKLHSYLTKDRSVHDEGKATNNLLNLLCHLYQLKSIDCKVILDFFNLFVISFTEKDVELMLVILSKVGFQLRKDDPNSLQDIVKKVTSKCEDFDIVLDDGSRMSYMLSILVAVKNNNVKKVTGYDGELISTNRKKVASLTKSSQEMPDNMPSISLQDFMNVNTGGRWWIVGSSFAGRPMLRDPNPQESTEKPDLADESVSSKIIGAAKMQRMNTDVRRKIFYAVMSADDYVDAFQKVIKCGLKGKQLREIAVVVVDCCQQEKKFNPYYLHLLKRFCQHDRQFVISLQCTLWDRFKLVTSLKQSQRMNIAEMTARLIVVEAIPLSTLKGIDFSEMDKTLVQFLRSILCSLATHAQDPAHLKTVFDRLSATTKFKIVCQGVALFLRHFVLSDATFMSEHDFLRDSFNIMLFSVGKMNKTFL